MRITVFLILAVIVCSPCYAQSGIRTLHVQKTKDDGGEEAALEKNLENIWQEYETMRGDDTNAMHTTKPASRLKKVDVPSRPYKPSVFENPTNAAPSKAPAGAGGIVGMISEYQEKKEKRAKTNFITITPAGSGESNQ